MTGVSGWLANILHSKSCRKGSFNSCLRQESWTFQFFEINTFADLSVPVMPLCAQHAVKIVIQVKNTGFFFFWMREGLINDWWYGNKFKMHDSSRIRDSDDCS